MTIVRDITGAGVGSSFSTTSTAIAVVGGRLQVDQVAGAAALDVWTGLGLTGYAFSMELQLSALPAAEQKLVEPFTVGNTRSLGVAIHQSGDVRLRDAANVDRGFVGVSLTPGVIYRLEVKSDGSASASVAVYSRYGTTPLGSLTYTGAAGVFAAMDKFRWGAVVSTVTMPRYFVDRLRVADSNAFIGPAPGGSSNAAPTADAGTDKTATTGVAVTFTGAGSDADGAVSSYAWAFGDGGTATGATVTHTYTMAGTYTAVLTVTDDQGATATDTATVSISSPTTPTTPTDGLVRAQTGAGVGDAFSTTSTAIVVTGGRLQVDQVAGVAAMDTWTGLALTGWAATLEFELTALPSAEAKLIEPFTVGNLRTLGVALTSTGDIRLRDAGNVDRGLAGVALVPGTKYRLEVKSDGSTTATAKVSPAAGTLTLGQVTYTGAAGPFAAMDKFRWGSMTSLTPPFPRFYVDYVAVSSSNSFIGPRPQPGGVSGRKARVGGVWVTKGVRRHRVNGVWTP